MHGQCHTHPRTITTPPHHLSTNHTNHTQTTHTWVVGHIAAPQVEQPGHLIQCVGQQAVSLGRHQLLADLHISISAHQHMHINISAYQHMHMHISTPVTADFHVQAGDYFQRGSWAGGTHIEVSASEQHTLEYYKALPPAQQHLTACRPCPNRSVQKPKHNPKAHTGKHTPTSASFCCTLCPAHSSACTRSGASGSAGRSAPQAASTRLPSASRGTSSKPRACRCVRRVLGRDYKTTVVEGHTKAHREARSKDVQSSRPPLAWQCTLYHHCSFCLEAGSLSCRCRLLQRCVQAPAAAT